MKRNIVAIILVVVAAWMLICSEREYEQQRQRYNTLLLQYDSMKVHLDCVLVALYLTDAQIGRSEDWRRYEYSSTDSLWGDIPVLWGGLNMLHDRSE